MKKLFLFFILLIAFVITGCNDHTIKTEYFLNEPASIDDIDITMTNARYYNNLLEVEFKITNKRDNTISISADTFFKLYDINKVQKPNKYDNNSGIIKKGDTINYTLQYDISEKSIYEIYFYSGIVENNIKFTITDLQ